MWRKENNHGKRKNLPQAWLAVYTVWTCPWSSYYDSKKEKAKDMKWWIYEFHIFKLWNKKALLGGLQHVSRGGHWGVPNTAISCRKSTKYRYRIYDRSHLLNIVSILRVCYLKHENSRNQPQPSQENVRSRIDWYNDKKARLLDVLSFSS